MQDRWSESDAGALGAGCESSLAQLVYATRLLGAEPDLAMHGGGNTSCKCTLKNALGDEQKALFIKASGVELANIGVGDFVALDLPYLIRLAGLAALSDEEMADEFASHVVRPTARRASVETLMHALLPAPFVLHTHPSAILALGNRTDGEKMVAAALGDGIAVVPYARAGLELAQAVRAAMAQNPRANALVLMHHGLVPWGASPREAYQSTLATVSRAEQYLHENRKRALVASPIVSTERERRCSALAPIIRGVLGPASADDLGGRVVLAAVLDADIADLLDSPQGRALALSPPLSPDYLVRTRRHALWLDRPSLDDAKAFKAELVQAVEAFQAEYLAYVRTHAKSDAAEARDFCPRVLMIPGLGVICAGKDAADARMVSDITVQALRAKKAIYETGGDYRSLSDDHLFDMEFRAYQRAKTAPREPSSSLRGSVAIVTGAAGAIGSGICEALLERGCHVAATDLPGLALEALTTELGGRYPLHVLGIAMDVTSPASVAAAFGTVVRAWGGIDAVVVNAGIAHVAPLVDLSLETFRKLERVNGEGTLLVLAEAGRHFALQGQGGDVVLVSTKNVFAPGAGFGAYSATKAASHQLARIASLEFAPLSVRVNMVAPDAVFSHGGTRSGLWAAVGPNRMKARGLDEHGLEEYYRSRNLLKAKVTAQHVAAAVLFFLGHQTPTTGATIPVDGGLPDATPR